MKILLILLLPFFIITGTVINEKTGERLANVDVFENNSKIGTLTDSNGQFKLYLNKNNADIEISEDGFKIFYSTLILKSDTCLNIKLKPLQKIKND